MTTESQRPKVICLGLGRTGTSSLHEALEMLGFGPAYHMKTIILKDDPAEFDRWRQFAEGTGSTELMHELLDDYGSVLDYPPALYPEEVYAAYPDAKFILSIRNPEKWKKSMDSTLLWAGDALADARDMPLLIENQVRFNIDIIQKWYHGGRLRTDAQGELLRHNERVKALIPSDKLLVYEVGEGWQRLADFLGVPTPEEPFPHVNDTDEFRKRVEDFMKYTVQQGVEEKQNDRATNVPAEIVQPVRTITVENNATSQVSGVFRINK